MIAVLIPVLNRPQNAQQVRDSITRASSKVTTILFLVSYTDIDERETVEQLVCPRIVEEVTGTVAYPDVWMHVVPIDPGPGDFARKQNIGLHLTTEPYVFAGADDLVFTPGWDVEALKVAADTRAGVIGTNDLGNPMVKRGQHSTHSLISRAYAMEQGASMDGPGTIYSEAYDHQCVDNELVGVAKHRREWAFAGRSIVEHLHPFWPDGHGGKKGVMDSTYEKALAHGQQDIQLLNQRKAMWNGGRPR